MTTIAMSSPFPGAFSLYDDENSFQQECLNMSPSLGQHVNVADFESLAYSTAFPSISYTAPMMTMQHPTSAPLSIYTNNLDNYSSTSLASASPASVSSAYYSDIGFAQCGVDAHWTHIDDGYVSGDTSPITQTMPQDAFYPDQVVLLDGSSLNGLNINSQVETTAILNDQAAAAAAAAAAVAVSASMASATPDQLQYTMFDPASNSPAMGVTGLGLIDPLSAESYLSSAESSPVLAARSKSLSSRSPSPPHQSYYSFDKGAMKCPQKGCTKAFSRVYNLKTHLKSHVTTKPWECPMCPRSFTRKHDLQRHVRVHTGQKPYVCPCCHKRFARTDALTRHIRVEDSCRLSEEVANYKGRRRYSDLS